MKKISKKNLDYLEILMGKYNGYSELVAVNYYWKHDKEVLEWNRGSLNKIEEHLEVYAEMIGVNLVFAYGPHPFLNREPLEYRTVHLEGEDTNYRRTTVCDIKIR